MLDLVSTQKGGVQNLARVALSIGNAFPQATATSSPKATGLNSLGTSTAIVVIGTSTVRHGVLFHNPGGTTVIVYVFPSTMTPAPTTTTLGGTLGIAGGSTVFLPSAQFPNINCGFSAFAGTGTNQPFTAWEFL